MTIFGPDVSSYQHGIDVAALPDPFVLLKVTEGTYYADADYEGWLGQAKTSGKLAVAYHFVVAGEAPDDQAAWIAAWIVDASLPLMLDVEPTGSSRPTLPQVLALTDRCAAHGLRPRLAYLPRWYWSQIGSPDLTPLKTRGIALVSSAYPGGAGYPGDGAAGWQPYGGMTPLLYQYTDHAVEGGQLVGDMNAFKGTREQLAAFLGAPPTTSPPTPQGGSTMGTIPPSISQKWPELAGDFPPNATFTDESALIWADGGARAAALYARQARDLEQANSAKLDQLLARPASASPPAVDVNALAAALAPHITAGASPDAVANAVVAHLAATLAKG